MYNLIDIHFHTDDSFNAFEKKPFGIEKLISVLYDEDVNYDVKLLCKMDHNRFILKKYLVMPKKLSEAKISLLELALLPL